MGESSIGKMTTHSNCLCLVCGCRGGNSVVVTSAHSFVKSSGTSLTKFLNKIVGEDPCYSLSDIICEPCYKLLDRLDTYQHHVSQIESHINSKYKDTKMELLGQRLRLSDMISSSLSNPKEVESGTTLNFNNELTITVVHDPMPKKKQEIPSKSLTEVFGDENEPLTIRERAFPNLISSLKKRKSPERDEPGSKKVKTNETPQATGSKIRKSRVPNFSLDNDENNPDSYYSMAVRNLSSLVEMNRQDLLDRLKDCGDQVSDEVLIYRKSDMSLGRQSLPLKMNKTPLTMAKDSLNWRTLNFNNRADIFRSIKNKSKILASFKEKKEKKVKQSLRKQRLSLPDLTILKSHLIKTANQENQNSQSNNPKDILPELSCTTLKAKKKIRKPKPKVLKNPQTTTQLVPDNTEIMHEPETILGDQTIKIKEERIDEEEGMQMSSQYNEYPTQTDTNEQQTEVPSFMQDPNTTSLLQTFLSGSLWFGGAETEQQLQPEEADTSMEKDNQENDDVTTETLAMAAGAFKDKKKRLELKNTGQSYVNTKGQIIEAKRVHPQDCSRCPLKCNQRISEDDRLSIFAEFWGLADYNLQREYLAKHMEREEKVALTGSIRTVVLYYITHQNKRMQVCRQFFLKTLDVSEKASRVVLDKKNKTGLGTANPNTKTVFLNKQKTSNDHFDLFDD